MIRTDAAYALRAISEYCCFNCDSTGGGYYKPHDGETTWYIGLDSSGQANYACAECQNLLFDAHPVTKRDTPK